MSSNVLIAAIAAASGTFGVLRLLSTVRLRDRTKKSRADGSAFLMLVTKVGRSFSSSKPVEKIEVRLLAAGQPYGLDVGEVVASKFGGALLLGLLILPLAPLLPGKLPIAAVLAAPLLGFYLPDLRLRDLAVRRGKQIARELPDVLDLVRITVNAGLGLERAFAQVGQRHVGVLALEISRFARQLRLGVPTSQALRQFRMRCPSAGVEGFVLALDRSLKQGTPLSDLLSAQAREARSQRVATIREHAAKASPKIQVLVALILTPSVMLLVGATLVKSFI